MNVYIITFCHAQAGVFGLIETAFFDEEECKRALEKYKLEDDLGIEYVMDELKVGVTIQ